MRARPSARDTRIDVNPGPESVRIGEAEWLMRRPGFHAWKEVKMHRKGRWGFCALLITLAFLVGSAAVAQVVRPQLVPGAVCSATFTPAGAKGTFPGTFSYDRKKGEYTADLSAIPAGATVFRAELMLNGLARFQRPSTKPTTVYVVGEPDKPLKFVAPRYRSLDALEAVRAAVKAGAPLRVRAEVTLRGISHLAVSYVGGRPKAASIPTVKNVKAVHRAGQTIITFTEPPLEKFPEFATGADVAAFKKDFLKKHPGIAFRIWRGPKKITRETIVEATLVGQCGPFTAWNSTYHQYNTRKAKPVRYRVTDGGDPVPWGTGIYAHNPAEKGTAYYAVTVALNGEEDLSNLTDANTAGPVDEVVGLGEPILQWIEHVPGGKGWSYRRGPLTRLIYTRWESWPHSSFPNNPIDYLVAMGDAPKPEKPPREWQRGAWRVEPAPVGLHLHCWGGSLNGGYGWWYNAHRGAVLIASNQIPYDWWTGYHESRGTCKTYGDGHVHPFTMNRMFGFLDWATTQWKDAPAVCRKYWRKLDLTRVFTAGSSMGGSGAPMYAIRYGDRIAWCIAWVGVHIPHLSPTFANSYRGSYGPEKAGNTMPDGATKAWDYFNDVWWLKNNVGKDTGLIIASNGKSDGGIGWPQAYLFARALQETRRPHIYNWGPGGHGTRTIFGANVPFDARTDQSLPAFTNCSLDGNIGTGRMKTKEEMKAERDRIAAELRKAGKPVPKRIHVLPTDGDPSGAYNAYLRWKTDDIVDEEEAWEMTVYLAANAPKDACTVDLTPRRLQKFSVKPGQKFNWTNTPAKGSGQAQSGAVVADKWGLVTLPKLTVTKSGSRVRLTPAK